jgi:phenylacetate-coenzyme A ligase PaaK-like adenylate-forming protein
MVAGLNAYQPSVLNTYPTVLHALTAAAESGDLRIAPETVVSIAEPLLPEIRAAAERVWGVPVINVWGASEGVSASSCGHGSGLHLSDDLAIVEPVDLRGQPVAAGERAAKIYVTVLYNHTLPLIRYEISDEITVLDSSCPCGSAHRLLADPLGRLDDAFHYGDLMVHRDR